MPTIYLSGDSQSVTFTSIFEGYSIGGTDGIADILRVIVATAFLCKDSSKDQTALQDFIEEIEFVFNDYGPFDKRLTPVTLILYAGWSAKRQKMLVDIGKKIEEEILKVWPKLLDNMQMIVQLNLGYYSKPESTS